TTRPAAAWKKSGRSYLRLKPVPESAHRSQILRIVGFSFDSLTKPADVHVDRAWAHVMLLAPDLLEQLLAIVGSAGVSQKKLEQTEFGRGKREFLVAQGQPVGGPVQREWAQLQQPGRRVFDFLLITAAKVRLDAGHQLARAERLGDVVVAADLEPQHAVYF